MDGCVQQWKAELLHEIEDGRYKNLRIVPFRKTIFRVHKPLKFLVPIIMWSTGRPLTVVASEILVQTAPESGTGSLSDVVRLYKGLIILKAKIFLEMKLRVGDTT